MYFRAFYAIRPLSNRSGMPTNALYGFLSMSSKLLRETKPEYIAYCFDTAAPNFRKDLYPDYKANRTEMPADLVPQVPYVRRITEALGIAAFEKPGWEADDLIGHFTHLGRGAGLDVVIVSGDKDFAQLVDDHVTLYDTMKDTRLDTNGVLEKWGVRPNQMGDYLALIGDASDNVPGVDGIGPKGAQKLLAEFGSLQGIYDNLEMVKNPKLREKLELGKKNAFLSRKLIQIASDVPMGVDVQSLKPKPIEPSILKNLLDELDFKSFEPKLLGQAPPLQSTETVVSVKGAVSTGASYPTQMGFDFSENAEPVGIVESWDQFFKVLSKDVPIELLWTGRELIVAQEHHFVGVTSGFREIGMALAGINLPVVGHEVKECLHRLEWPVDLVPRCTWDTQLASYCLKPGRETSFEALLTDYLGSNLPLGANSKMWIDTFRAMSKKIKIEVEATGSGRVLETLDLPLIPILYRMEKLGMSVDRDLLKQQSREIDSDLKELETQIYALAGEKFLVSSPKQLAQVLFDKLKLPHGRKTKSGYSTDHDVLWKLAKEFPICDLLIQHRELAKLKSTYTDALFDLVSERDGRVHTSFNATVTATGRLSSTQPNLQNIPIRTSRGREVRKAFIPAQGAYLLTADYSQIELRILAHISEDPGLIRSFEEDLDIHSATAGEIFGVELKQVTTDQRRIAKAVNFGLAYGMSAYGLAENLDISKEEAGRLVNSYFAKFSRVRQYMGDVVESAKKNGYVETLFGRRRYLPEITTGRTQQQRSFAERAAINSPIQGTAADLVKLAMISVSKISDAKLLLQVHDELVFEVEQELAQKVGEQVKAAMEGVFRLKVPLKVNIGVGVNWDAAHG